MNKLIPIVFIGLQLSFSGYAEAGLGSDLLGDLQQDMDKFSDLATDTKQNQDYMPYVISSLGYKELSDLGVSSLREALTLIPGVDLNVGMAGVKNPIFRGSNPYAFGQSRLIIDGLVVNDQIFGGYNQYLDLPVELIHRIEVVRGPGSLLAHENGYAGSIHVITKANRDDGEKQKDIIYSNAGSDDLIEAGLISSFVLGDGNLKTDIYYKKHDLILPVGVDRFGKTGETDQSLNNYQIGLNYDVKKISAKARFSNNESGVSYGQAFSLTDDASDYLNVGNNHFQIKYKDKLSARSKIEIALDYNDERRELQNKVLPDGAMSGMLPNGRYFLVDYKEKKISQRVQLNTKFSSDHKLIIGFKSEQSEILKNDAAISNDNLVTFTRFNLFTNNSRDKDTLFVEDSIDLSEKTSLQIGGKFSQFDDVEDQKTARVSVVHRYNNVNIYKAMFSQADREPSWREQYLSAPAYFLPNPILDSEKVNAFEISYIRKTKNSDYFKINGFYLENKDQIDAQNGSNTFENTDDNSLSGFELEYKKTINHKNIFHVNYSYITGGNVSGILANTAKNLMNMYYIHRQDTDWAHSILVRYIGEKGRVTNDTRDEVSEVSLVDVSTKYKVRANKLELSLSIKNIFDEEYFLPSPYGTYDGDFVQPGRTILLKLSKEF